MHSFLTDIIRTSRDICREGWAEANGGNITVRLDETQLSDRAVFHPDAPWKHLDISVPSLAGEYFLVTASGSQMRNIADYPSRDCGVLELSDDGAAYRVVWGLEDGGRPTSEFFAHLLSHAIRKEHSGGVERVILHTHPATLIALTHTRELDSRSLTRLLWGMHTEGVCLFPGGVAYLPYALPGSQEIARLTCDAFQSHSMVLWEFHGIFASGASLDQVFGMVQAAEKAAKVYQLSCTMGGMNQALSDRDIQSIADSLHITPIPGILSL